MKVFIKCRSPLLQKTLESMLKEFSCEDLDLCDIALSDTKLKAKNTFIVGKDILHPFTKDELLSSLEEFMIREDVKSSLKEIKKEQTKKINNLAKRIK